MKTRRKFLAESLFVAAAALTLPSHLSADKKIYNMTDKNEFDVIIIGGSYAGLSAAMALGRSLRNVLIIDAGNPCNKQTPFSHNFITQDGKPPAVISDIAKDQVLKYPNVQFLKGTAKSAIKNNIGIKVLMDSGKAFHGRKLIMATGITDILPEIDGFAECWGITAIHCPYCHGYEVRQAKTGILANGDSAYETAKLISNWTNDLTIFTNGQSKLTIGQVSELKQKGILIIEKEISSIIHHKGHIDYLVFNDNSIEKIEALYARVPFKQHSNILQELGCEMNEQGFVKVDQFQKTSIPDIYACGDNTTFLRSVAQAVYTGSVAGASANLEMIKEDWI
ncbi:NAD(P)/FAD-dependent oxidoreductase [Sphingobacterium sp. B16(2022)]|uniref:NAD(P)/FAD-dependent oxidoreductase n=1 Tax=Sphingobacterium sp. B16(2022) TaxID=2914044 RepID=UPI001F43DF2B|nr:NAD(P)/FAD-dependent oxidoreductase [Sphingobacterium sp. B16(2022)]